jgi:2'-5' RNA ligase
VLRPDQATKERLNEISALTQSLIEENGFTNYNATTAENFHVTLASPLPPMDSDGVKGFMKRLATSLTGQEPLSYELRLVPGSEANYTLNFGASDGNPYVTLKVFSDQGPPVDGMTPPAVIQPAARELGEKVNELARTIADGKHLKQFKPHVTLGNFTNDQESGKTIHILDRHNKTKKTALGATIGEFFQSKLTLAFPTIELLQVDKVIGKEECGYATLATYNLGTKDIAYFDIPPCVHAEFKPASSITPVIETPKGSNFSQDQLYEPYKVLGECIQTLLDNDHVSIRSSKDAQGNFSFQIAFAYPEEAQMISSMIGNCPIGMREDRFPCIEVGEQACITLLGEDLGSLTYCQASIYDSEGLSKTYGVY